MSKDNSKKKGIYIHIPFCKYICSYCDFNKFYIQHQPVDEYIDILIIELDTIIDTNNIETVYIGGGTPSALSDDQLIRLLIAVNKKVTVNKLKEFSFEANPEDLTIDRVNILKRYGVNRVSMGVQTLNNKILEVIGRGHKKDDVKKAITNLKNVNINNINVDLMFALPGQTVEDLCDSMETIVSYGINHISCYSLILEQRTKLYNQVKSKHIILPTNEVEEQMYDLTINYLNKQGFIQYEISNFSKQGSESIHNSNYWLNYEYYGIGAGAHGYIDGIRYSNHGPVKFYIDSIVKKGNARRVENKVTEKEKIEEHFFLGLRLLKGVDLDIVDNKYNINSRELYKKSIDKNISAGYLKLENNILSLTRKGLFYGNDVFADFLIID
ncbi:oxygen-independent coproporphyrinogen III oxidase [Gemella sp. GH3]|uniref:radical SAM family heme chaperone HemW n=1 Tax=unclassified Gemella TaxID=2624949 RepID=UPI0015D00041|nr:MULTISPECIES: radical SAM family heme chaperone HemW [unclassified Gemella]MBF0714330.1 oxygen-independent coproporphyrinogen III oxidase [Gemella sp. GH3.1]NYS51282.1 oxygen-independent coproporphyrinogen III oxidase [Gemella sp. GH3]